MRRLILLCIALLTLSSCIELDYYLQSMTGHLEVMRKRQSIQDLLTSKDTSVPLQQRLEQIEEIRDFASQTLQLPENDSYRSYVDLDRPYVVWNVVATPEYSLEPLQWCFPVVGCVDYRGYFDQKKAEKFAASLPDDQFDTIIVGVPAYSTLNWFDDPVLSTFSNWPLPSVAKLIFHELAHQKLYVPDDTTFNESFATAVAQVGIDLWLKKKNVPQLTQSYAVYSQRQEQFNLLLLQTRHELQTLYSSELPLTQKHQVKLNIFDQMRQSYQQLRQSWDGYSGYDAWFSQLNNARFASLNNYHRWVPAFLLAMQQEHADWDSFYRRCRAIAILPQAQRHQLLDRLAADYKKQNSIGLSVKKDETDDSL